MHFNVHSIIFTIGKIWKQPKYPLTDDWKRKMWYIHTHTHTHNRILLSHKKNEIMPFAATWIDLKIIILSGVNQTEKDE